MRLTIRGSSTDPILAAEASSSLEKSSGGRSALLSPLIRFSRRVAECADGRCGVYKLMNAQPWNRQNPSEVTIDQTQRMMASSGVEVIGQLGEGRRGMIKALEPIEREPVNRPLKGSSSIWLKMFSNVFHMNFASSASASRSRWYFALDALAKRTPRSVI